MKVCGLRDRETVDAAVGAGADAVGFVFAPGSVRTVPAVDAAPLVAHARERGVLTVGVFRNQPLAEVVALAELSGVAVVQLHGAEPAADHRELRERGWPTIRAMAARDYAPEREVAPHPADHLLLDAPEPGAGRLFDGGGLVERPPSRDWVLAGGLTPGNVAERIRTLRPWGVDVSSGVESSPGVKSVTLVREFVHAAQQGETEAPLFSTEAPLFSGESPRR